MTLMADVITAEYPIGFLKVIGCLVPAHLRYWDVLGPVTEMTDEKVMVLVYGSACAWLGWALIPKRPHSYQGSVPA